MSVFEPNFSKINEIEEKLLVARLEAVRSTISHAGEKGRSLEMEVLTLLRDLLPSEYGLSTGFIVYHTAEGPKLSKQLDIIIYDAIRSGPLVKLQSCDVFPLEAVYGYIEVKSSIQSTSDDAEKYADNSIETCLQNNKILRGMVDRRFTFPDTPVTSGLFKKLWMPLRSYVFAFSPEGLVAESPVKLAQRIANVSKQLGPPIHLHGIFIANHSYLVTRAVSKETADKNPSELHHIQYTEEHHLMAFKTSLLRALATFPRFPADMTPAVHEYYDLPAFHTIAPEN